MTSGGDLGTNGARRGADWRRDPRFVTVLAFIPFGILYMAVNAASMIDQRRALGRPIDAWQAWVLEGSSFAAWLILIPAVLALALRLLSQPLWRAALGHAAGLVMVSCVHTVMMAVFRMAIYGLAGEDYAPTEPWSERLLFEGRKDIITYASILAVYLLARRLVSTPVGLAAAAGSVAEPALIEVRDGSRVVKLRPDEIDWVSAAGNYVELHGAFGSELARRTLADLEAELAPHGFARIHRSRLVRRAAVEIIATHKSGDFTVTLRSGTVIAGSRRFRQNLG